MCLPFVVIGAEVDETSRNREIFRTVCVRSWEVYVEPMVPPLLRGIAVWSCGIPVRIALFLFAITTNNAVQPTNQLNERAGRSGVGTPAIDDPQFLWKWSSGFLGIPRTSCGCLIPVLTRRLTKVGFGASSPECRWLYTRGVHV
ncbi:hypothetical protein PILCRDRAFT_573784 [Piloderma croceum F 1598]|uniref:Uncharacterized protein n=1 Tax=Piloderma croceum (strain F 1598) TaxID=765440 RepID=A0A0C3FGP6_PILCF|nr:hypothetical protein PILCRDRAFT_573784 [Piloderma croceum F 1598]